MLNNDMSNKITDFSIRLFKEVAEKENVVVSPISLLAPLLMAQMGADGETLRQIEAVTQMNPEVALKYLNKALEDSEENGKLNFANALFVNNNDSVRYRDEYFSLVKSLGNLDMFKEVFSAETCKKINSWGDKKTDGAIPKILSEIPKDAAMIILNAIYFNKDWKKEYTSEDVHKHLFNEENGTGIKADFMFGTEKCYFKCDTAHGFSKAYSDGRYEFVAILPGNYDADRESLVEWLNKMDLESQATIIQSMKQSRKDVDYDYLLSDDYIKIPEIRSFIDSLTAEGLRELMSKKVNFEVKTAIPKFEVNNALTLAPVLQDMGITDAFDVKNADFSRIGKAVEEDYNLCIDDVKQQALIKVNEKGTIAAAITFLGLKCCFSCAVTEHRIYLDRPFIYLIWDNKFNIPLFIGKIDHLNELSERKEN